jgi:hypothetical protein
MADAGTNVFFVPYRPKTSKEPKSKEATDEKSEKPAISRQKHAAREYHRKAKLERTAKLNAQQGRHARSTSVSALDAESIIPSRPVLPRSRSHTDEQDYYQTFAIFDVPTDELDSLSMPSPDGVPAYALEMLDYGKPAGL